MSKTNLSIILDRSGSMVSTRQAMEEALNNLILEQRKVPGECAVSLYQFDDVYDVVFEFKPIDSVRGITITPRGSTALHDAIGKTLLNVGSQIKENPGIDKNIIVIITDGQENASKEFSSEQINTLITDLREKNNWQFLFLGANQDAIKTGSALGMLRGQTMTYSPTYQGTQVMTQSVHETIASFRSGHTSGAQFTEDDRAKQNELLKGKSI